MPYGQEGFHSMVKKIVGQKRGRGRPVTIAAERSVTIRLPEKLLDEVDAWASAHMATKSEAIRKLLERSLKRKL